MKNCMGNKFTLAELSGLLGVDTVDKFKKLLEQCIARRKDQQWNYSGLWDYDVRPIENVIDVEKIATTR